MTTTEIDTACAILRQASTGTMVFKGKRITQAQVRKAQAVYAEWLANR